MSKIYLDLKVTNSVPSPHECTADEISRLCGANIGNLAFRYALRFILDDFFEYCVVDYSGARQLANRGEVSEVIVSCANWLGVREQDERSNKVRADVLASIDAPVVVFGLGAQAESTSEGIRLGPESQRLAHILASKAEKISVRDRFTKQVLEEIGVENAVVTGCPSNFISCDPGLGKSVQKRALALRSEVKSWKELRTSITEFSGGHPMSGKVLRRHIETLREAGAFYVVQSPMLLPLLFGETHELERGYIANSPEGPIETQQLIRARALHFTSVESWLDFSRTCDLSLGMRIHGNMIPLQAGVPSVLIGHDSRTMGLASEMGIPMVSPVEYVEAMHESPAALLDVIADGMSRYDARRSELAEVMVKYLETNNLRSAKEIRGLCA